MTLELRSVTRRFSEGSVALDDVTLALPTDGYVCVMGSSGSGKTTLLRIIAGLEPADIGTVSLDGATLDGVPPQLRPVHTVFQDHALFPHLDVLDNIAFAACVAGERRANARAAAMDLLSEVGLPEHFGRRAPGTLSGGEAQRVALARALMRRPRLVLLDEPLAALDRGRRAELRRMLHRVQRTHDAGFIHVTHDPEDALALADQVVVLADGSVLEIGAPAELYRRPQTLAAARLFGELTAVPGQSDEWLRPERLRVVGEGGRVRARIVRVVPLGASWELELVYDDQPCLARIDRPMEVGECSLDWSPEDVLSLRK